MKNCGLVVLLKIITAGLRPLLFILFLPHLLAETVWRLYNNDRAPGLLFVLEAGMVRLALLFRAFTGIRFSQVDCQVVKPVGNTHSGCTLQLRVKHLMLQPYQVVW